MSTNGIGNRIAAESSLYLQSIGTGTYGQQRSRGVIRGKNPAVQSDHDPILGIGGDPPRDRLDLRRGTSIPEEHRAVSWEENPGLFRLPKYNLQEQFFHIPSLPVNGTDRFRRRTRQEVLLPRRRAGS